MVPFGSYALVCCLAVLILVGGCRADIPPNSPEAILPVLVSLLTDPSPDLRRTAAMALGKIGRAEAVLPLLDRLDDPDPQVREYAAWALGSLGEPVRNQAGVPLTKMLYDPSPAVREAASLALGALGRSPGIVRGLQEAVESDKIHARRWAVHGLGYLEVQSAFPTMVRVLKDQESAVRQEALAAMGELAEYKALPLFHARLVGDPSPAVRGEAAFRLGKLGSVEDIPALEQALRSETHPVVRRWVQWAIEAVTPTGGFD